MLYDYPRSIHSLQRCPDSFTKNLTELWAFFGEWTCSWWFSTLATRWIHLQRDLLFDVGQGPRHWCLKSSPGSRKSQPGLKNLVLVVSSTPMLWTRENPASLYTQILAAWPHIAFMTPMKAEDLANTSTCFVSKEGNTLFIIFLIRKGNRKVLSYFIINY